MKTFKTFLEAVVKFEDHDADDSDFKALLKKLGLQAKTKGDVTTVTGNNAKINKLLKTMKMAKDDEGYAVVESLNLEAGFGKHQGKVDKTKLMKQYKDNEDNNAHTENYLMLATFFGTEDEVKKVKDIMKRNKKQGSTSESDNDWMYKNINKYYKKLK